MIIICRFKTLSKYVGFKLYSNKIFPSIDDVVVCACVPATAILISLILIRWYYLFFACILLILSVYLRAHRWKYLFTSNTKLNVYRLFKSQFIGYFINCVSPLRIGDIIRSYVVAKNTKQKTIMLARNNLNYLFS